ncbi:MAG: DUF523 domain-containing protein [Collinsella sp.]|nr:DUF523 domain-containing protein [Collinsella sp.]
MRVCVSACLLGERCKYNGGDNLRPGLSESLADDEVVAVCPEILGGLPVPRDPAELRGGRVVTERGEDVTDAFCDGVRRALRIIEEAGGVDMAILQPRSPSCGVNEVYDGTFSGCLVEGSGLFACALRERGIPVREP